MKNIITNLVYYGLNYEFGVDKGINNEVTKISKFLSILLLGNTDLMFQKLICSFAHIVSSKCKNLVPLTLF